MGSVMKMPSEHLTKDRWEYWLRLPGWSHYEAAQLFFRIDPDHPNAAHNVKSANDQGFYFPVWKLFEHFRRCGLSRYDDDGALVSDRLPPKEWVKAFLLLPDVELPFVLPEAEGENTKECVIEPIQNPQGIDSVQVTLPHMTKALDAVFRIMRNNWEGNDPNRQPKQVNIAAEIDEALGWKPEKDGVPSRNARAIAAIIKPDNFNKAE